MRKGVDMADDLSTGERSFSSIFFEASDCRKLPGGEAAAAGEVYLPGGW
jgi:hypothetical protein